MSTPLNEFSQLQLRRRRIEKYISTLFYESQKKAVITDTFLLPRWWTVSHVESSNNISETWFRFRIPSSAVIRGKSCSDEFHHPLWIILLQERMFQACIGSFSLSEAEVWHPQRLQGVRVYLDFIIIFGCSEDNHHHNLREVLHRISQASITQQQVSVQRSRVDISGTCQCSWHFSTSFKHQSHPGSCHFRKMSFRFAHLWVSLDVTRNLWQISRKWSNQCDISFGNQRRSSGTKLRNNVFNNWKPVWHRTTYYAGLTPHY